MPETKYLDILNNNNNHLSNQVASAIMCPKYRVAVMELVIVRDGPLCCSPEPDEDVIHKITFR